MYICIVLINNLNILIMELQCTICDKEKDISLFEKRQDSKSGYRSQCKECRDVKSKKWNRVLVRQMTSRKYKTSKNIEKSKDVTADFLLFLKEKQNGKCYWLNIDIDFTCKDKLRSPSIDRLDNEKGYTIDNIVLTTRFANLGRCDATVNEFNNFLKQYKQL